MGLSMYLCVCVCVYVPAYHPAAAAAPILGPLLTFKQKPKRHTMQSTTSHGTATGGDGGGLTAPGGFFAPSLGAFPPQYQLRYRGVGSGSGVGGQGQGQGKGGNSAGASQEPIANPQCVRSSLLVCFLRACPASSSKQSRGRDVIFSPCFHFLPTHHRIGSN